MKKAYEAPTLAKRNTLSQVTAYGCGVSMGKCGGPPPPSAPSSS